MTRPTGVDEHVGRRISTLRDSLGLTQSEIAAQMVGLGHAWHQQTVVKVEKGARPLRLAEAVAVARVLRIDVPVLLDDSDLVPVAALRARVATWETAHARALDAARHTAHARSRLAASLAGLDPAGVPDDLLETARAALTRDLADEVRDVVRDPADPSSAGAATLREGPR